MLELILEKILKIFYYLSVINTTREEFLAERKKRLGNDY